MNIKIKLHLMPWELDNTILLYSQLAKSLYHISDEDKIIFESCLNVSSYIINWEESKISKDFFIKKYKSLKSLLPNGLKYIQKIYDGDQLYGHLDFERESISPEIDAYIGVCPDMIFDERLLYYMIEGAKQIKNKYFVITPQIPKLWDSTWDPLVNPTYMNIPYSEWNKQDMFDIINNQNNSTQEVSLQPIQKSKYAGWFDLYSKSYCEELVPIEEEWKGKGGWDLYSMIVSDSFKQSGGDYQQYVLDGQTISRLSYCGNFKDGNLYSYYKDNIKLHSNAHQLNQITSFEQLIPYYVQRRISKFGDLK
jgi:hypothetical protein